jgi:hypothetical protein
MASTAINYWRIPRPQRWLGKKKTWNLLQYKGAAVDFTVAAGANVQSACKNMKILLSRCWRSKYRSLTLDNDSTSTRSWKRLKVENKDLWCVKQIHFLGFGTRRNRKEFVKAQINLLKFEISKLKFEYG